MISFPISSWPLAALTRSGAAHLYNVLKGDDPDGTLLPTGLGRHQQNVAATGLKAGVRS